MVCEDLSGGNTKSDRHMPPAPIPIKGGLEPMGVSSFGTRGDPILGVCSRHLACDNAMAVAEQHETTVEFITPKKVIWTCSFSSELGKASIV